MRTFADELRENAETLRRLFPNTMAQIISNIEDAADEIETLKDWVEERAFVKEHS